MLEVGKLSCEYKKNSLGIDVLRPRLSWKIESDSRSIMQVAYQIQVSCEDDKFNSLVWDTGRVESDQSIHVEYNGTVLKTRCRYYYRVRIWDNKGSISEWSEVAYWEMAFLNSNEWSAEWITADFRVDVKESGPSSMFRKTFELKSGIKKARIYVTSLGLYELHLNGSRVGDYWLTPGWTSYHKRLQYQTYDVTDMLKEGNNALGAILGDGWYRGNLVWAGRRNVYGEKAAVLIQMHVVYEDGKEEVIVTDNSWKASTGPILMSDIYNGEIYDARLEKEGWSTAGYNDADWIRVELLNHTREILIAQENVPVKIVDKIKPVSVIKTPAGETVLDIGQNMVGWMEFDVEGKEGDVVTLRHAEVLDKDGNFYTENLRSANQTIKYILKGKGRERYRPSFTFQGFRYVKVEGYPGDVTCESFTGLVIHSDMEQTGSFECSDELINQLQHNILWGQKGNFVDVPTDCPQRDERLGWTGDAQVFVRTAGFNMNVAPFFTKWLRDLKSDQSEEKGVPYVIPDVLRENSYSSSAWGDAAVICPWTIYLCYGDKRILEEQYDSMKSWVEYIRRQGDNEFLWNTGSHFGDWLGLDAKEGSYIGATAFDFIATAFFAYSTNLLVKAAKALGRNEDEKNYTELYSNIIAAFRKEFVTQSGRLAVPTQTAHVLALMFDLVDNKNRKRVADTLVQYLKENKIHLTTGFVGTPYLCHVLTENGYNDIAYELVLQKDYPSWLYQVTRGATTVWEHWDGLKEDGSFWSRDMNSFNHYAYGSIGDWLYRVVAGVDTEEPGYKNILIKPHPGGGFSYARASFESMYGKIVSAWNESEGKMEVEVVIPPNTTARVMLPFALLDSLTECGKDIGNAEGICKYEQTGKGVELEVGSGEYRFVYLKR